MHILPVKVYIPICDEGEKYLTNSPQRERVTGCKPFWVMCQRNALLNSRADKVGSAAALRYGEQ